MKHDTTIFDGAIKGENSFTELFKNFLRFKPFRRSFLDLIEFDFDREIIELDNFDTQFTIQRFGRPDLALFTDDTEILFEIKVYNETSLTQNQPIGYYKHLKTISEAKNKALVLIIPENYYDIKNYNSSLEKIKSDRDGIHTQIVYWETISSIITKNELECISPLFFEYSNFINSWFHLNSIYFNSLNTTTMFGTEFPDSLEKTMGIIYNTFTEFQKRGYSVNWSSDKHFEEYGFYFDIPDNVEIGLFFGIWFDYWKLEGNPICISLDTNAGSVMKGFRTAIKKNNLNPAKEFEETQVTYIDRQTLMDEKSEQKISKIITNIITEIGISNTPETRAEKRINIT